MNQNKGIIGIGLLVAIVLGIVVLGGGAYYLGKKNSSDDSSYMPDKECGFNGEKCNKDKNLQQDQNQLVADKSTIPQAVPDCNSSSKPSIKVISPNGGETYTLGQTIDIKWSSKCIDSKALVYLNIGVKDSQAVSELLDGLKVANNGSYNFAIPSNYNVGGNKSNKYEVGISYIYGNGEQVSDISDNSFTINSATPITWLKSPEFGLYYPNTLNIIEYYVDRYGKQVDKKDGMPMFYASWGEHQDSGITWGGNYEATNPTVGGGGSSCMDDNDFGVFQYGVSSITCLKGHVALVSRTSARNTITKEDLKMFGDFVLKNR